MDKMMRFPTSCNAKMAYGILSAFVARGFFNEGLAQLAAHNAKGAVMPFAATWFLIYTIGLCMVRFNTGRPLFERAVR